ncbi:hypothetical protein AWZ03_004303 [Drosophila navojoa]|uniref:Uncharacterized protein n=1 Tax=Drosophila navojoa TaxID=7232 RepID=A0A484BKM2_DRONA|nr:uncharacterized protein LOC108657004 [Drosophila navojoa]TDG49214.1 hypothetical protein AWZ03_004303 [Drosophila navojoa]
MLVRTKLIILLYLCLALHSQATRANPAEERAARTKNDVYDWISSLFGDYDSDESEEYLICRNCTVIVGQANNTSATNPPATAAPTPSAPTAAPTAAPAVTTPAAVAPPADTAAAAPPAPGAR